MKLLYEFTVSLIVISALNCKVTQDQQKSSVKLSDMEKSDLNAEMVEESLKTLVKVENEEAMHFKFKVELSNNGRTYSKTPYIVHINVENSDNENKMRCVLREGRRVELIDNKTGDPYSAVNISSQSCEFIEVKPDSVKILRSAPTPQEIFLEPGEFFCRIREECSNSRKYFQDNAWRLRSLYRLIRVPKSRFGT